MMDASAQFVFNVLVTLCGFLGGWVLKTISTSIEHLQQADAEIASKLQSMEVLIAGEYVKKEDMAKNIAAIFTKLDRIEAKIDRKQDK